MLIANFDSEFGYYAIAGGCNCVIRLRWVSCFADEFYDLTDYYLITLVVYFVL